MKTLLITTDNLSNTGGVSHYYYHLQKFWPSGDLAVVDNSEGKLLASGFWPKWRKGFFTIKRELRKQNPDWLLVGQILPLGTVAYLLSLFQPLKYCLIFHGMDLSLAFSGHKKILSRLIVNRASKIICANNFTAERLKKINSQWSAKIFVVNPGISPVDESLVKPTNSSNINLLSLGRLVRRKGIDKTIVALEILEKEFSDQSWWPGLTYTIAGTGQDEEYLKKIVSLSSPSLQQKIIFAGLVSGAQKWQLLNDCSIFAMPARDIAGDFEGFGIVYLEAGLCHKPVIAGLAGGVPDAVVNGENGLLCNPESPEDVAHAIYTLAADEALRNKLGENGHKRAKTFFWPLQAEKFYQYLLK
ncbi:MAG: glycosyltransferase family 4 protein [Candidatus Falkowbacteria bacterium]|nr:glycosyltransferase family 4 protein [Candidatus Falkowbacteria bacterium]